MGKEREWRNEQKWRHERHGKRINIQKEKEKNRRKIMKWKVENGFVSLFNGMSTFTGYLDVKVILVVEH